MYNHSPSPVATTILVLLLSPVTANPQAPLQEELEVPARNQTSVALVEAATTGSLEGEFDTFGRIMDVAIGADNVLYVADDLSHHVVAYNLAGEYLATIGRLGNGPGEFQSPWQISVGPADSIFVWDMERAIISVFAPDLDHVREFRVAPHWVITGIEFLPSGELLIAAFGSNETAGLHVVNRSGDIVRTIGSLAPTRPLQGFEGSLLGGYVEAVGDWIAYTNKSPYLISFFTSNGDLRATCTGDEDWTTSPEQVVVEGDGGYGLEWGKYTHSSGILPLSGVNYLNVVLDPVQNIRLLDVVSRDCELLSRSILREPVTFIDSRGEVIAAVRSSDYPEVVIYQMRMELN